MNVTNIDGSAQSIMPAKKTTQDSYEKNIQKQIANLQEKMKNINSDNEMPVEQKMNKKKEIQEQIQGLNSELRQYQAQKRQKEAAERQEAARRAAEKNMQPKQEEQLQTQQNKATTGVILTLSTTKEQIADMKKVRTDLQGKLHKARTLEEKESLQGKIDKLNEDIGKRSKESLDTIQKHQKSEKERGYKDRSGKSEQTEEEQNNKEETEDTDILVNHNNKGKKSVSTEEVHTESFLQVKNNMLKLKI